MTPLVEAEGLGRSFGGRVAVDSVDLALEGSECLALFGPNGAGKTTLLRLLAGLLRPTAGSAHVGGVPLPGGAAARAMIGLISHQSMLYGALSARENVELSARLHGVREPVRAARAALESMHIGSREATPVRTLSRGLQQRVSIARAMVHGPRVVLLDEPFTGLDESGAAALTAALVVLRDTGALLLLVTHNLGEGLALATHVAIMQRGRVVRHERRDSIDAGSYAASYRELVTHAG
ncbi:MAG: ABC transporter ATP-binding protein [Gemmatimonadaceae bacterium]